MKLAAHYNKVSIITSVTVLFAGAIVYFFAIRYIATQQLDRNLNEEIEEVQNFIQRNKHLPGKLEIDENLSSFTPTTLKSFNRRYFDTIYKPPYENKKHSGRAVQGLVSLNGKMYMANIIISSEATGYLIQLIAAVTMLLMLILIIALFLSNRFILGGMWKPFYQLLPQLKSFNVSENSNFTLKQSNVDEFNELGQAIQVMSSRVKKDYQHLKTFTENASHEMMTPLAVIISKLDTLIQDEALQSEQFEQLTDIYAAANKLSRVNHSLLLLVKIENKLIIDVTSLMLHDLIREKMKQFQELIQGKKISVVAFVEPCEIVASKYLVDILLNNLLSNAIRHNHLNGEIMIRLDNCQLAIQNSGDNHALNADVVFERFHKGQTSDGTGLGLAIVENISRLYDWEISYRYEEALHTFAILFKKQDTYEQSGL